jgi:hypothetical protein
VEPKHTPVQRSSGAGSIPLPRDAMRSLSGFPNPALPAMRPLALILAGVAAPVWGVAGLTLGLTLLGVLVLALAVLLSLVLAPIGFACRTWPDWRSGWLCRPEWFLDPWSWLCRCWLRWPWLCWGWLR